MLTGAHHEEGDQICVADYPSALDIQPWEKVSSDEQCITTFRNEDEETIFVFLQGIHRSNSQSKPLSRANKAMKLLFDGDISTVYTN